MTGAATLVVDVNEAHIDKRLAIGYVDRKTHDLREALGWILEAKAKQEALSVALVGNAAEVYPAILDEGIIPDIVTDQTAAHDLLYGYVPIAYNLDEVERVRVSDPDQLARDAGQSIAIEVAAMLNFKKQGAEVFDNGNNIRTQAKAFGLAQAFDIPIFTEAYLRPMFERAIGPFRWVALSGETGDIERIDDYLLDHFSDNPVISNWIPLAQAYIPFQGLPARIAWLGHKERSQLALAVNQMVAEGLLAGPIAFTRDHLDAGAMAHPNIMTENLHDGSDAVADWPLLDALLLTASSADLVAIHSGGGGYAGYMQSAGQTIIADGTAEAKERLARALDNDTAWGILRYADAGYPTSLEVATSQGIDRIKTEDYIE